MDVNALLIVDEVADGRLRGRLIDFDREFVPDDAVDLVRRDFVDVEVRFRMPGKDRDRSWRAQRELDESATARAKAFAEIGASVAPGCLLRLDHARGKWDPETKKGYLASAGAVVAGGPAETTALLALPREMPSRDDDALTFRTSLDVPFIARAVALADPAYDPNGPGWPKVLGGGGYEGQVLEDEARHEPNEAIVLVLGEDNAQLLATHGAYLFHADGTDARDNGMRHLPDEPGVYYVKGTPWGYGPDINGEYDSGFDVTDFAPAAAEHYALFGATEEDYAADIASYREEYAEEQAAPTR